MRTVGKGPLRAETSEDATGKRFVLDSYLLGWVINNHRKETRPAAFRSDAHLMYLRAGSLLYPLLS